MRPFRAGLGATAGPLQSANAYVTSSNQIQLGTGAGDGRLGAGPTASQSLENTSNTLTTLFVGGIPSGVSDGWIEKILMTCGPLKSFKRVRDQKGIPKSFAFAEYEEPDHVLRALSLLNGCKLPQLPITSPIIEKSLIVKADEKTRKSLDLFEEGRVVSSETEANHDSNTKGALQHVLHAIYDPQSKAPDSQFETESEREMRAREAAKHLQDLPDDMEGKEFLTGQIAVFRQQAQNKERGTKPIASRSRTDARIGNGHQHQQNNIASLHKSDSGHSPRSEQLPTSEDRLSRDRNSSTDIHAKGSVDQLVAARLVTPAMTDEEIESARLARRRKQNELAYHQRLKAWEGRENVRIAAWRRDKERLRRETEMQGRKAQEELAFLLSFREDSALRASRDLPGSLNPRIEKFFKDKAAWLRERAAFRRREVDIDTRQKAQDEERDAKLQAQTQNFLETLRGLPMAGMNGSSIAIKFSSGSADHDQAGEVSMSSKPTKRAQSSIDQIFDDELQDALRPKKRLILPMDYDNDYEGTTAPMVHPHDGASTIEEKAQTGDEEARAVRKLVEMIPIDQDGIYGWPVKWQYLSKNESLSIIEGFASKKLGELLGEEDQDLVAFVMEKVKMQVTASQLHESMEEILADDAADFVASIWRRLIFETESAAQKELRGPDALA